MNILKIAKERIGYLVVAAMVAVAVIVPGLVSAAQVTERSIGLSSSSADASDVSYEAKFTVPSNATTRGAFSITFCDNTPDPGVDCNAPAGLVTTSASSASSGFTTVTAPTTNSVVAAGTINPSDVIDVVFEHIHNPTAAGPLYARIATYATAAAATTDIGTTVPAGRTGIDNGGVAISITPTIGVSGAVLESMTFCVANQTITENCGDASITSHLPNLRLGEQVGSTGTYALDSAHLSTGTLYAQLSTNATGGAAVYIKSGNDCGGLKRVDATVCDIAPSNTTNFIAGAAEFGVKLGTAAGVGTSANGTLSAAGVYDASNYKFQYNADKSIGVTSPMGDLILNSTGTINNQQIPLIFGASVSNSTPAGNYATTLSLIATGKF